MADFTPDQEKEFEFRQRYEQEQATANQPEAAPVGRPEATTESTNQIMSGGIGGAAGMAANKLPEMFGNMVKDPITGKWMALENYGRQMAGGKWYGGKHMGDVYQRIVAAGADPALAAQYEAEALKQVGKGSKLASNITSKLPQFAKPLVNAPLGTIGRGLVGVGAGMQGADAFNRWNRGDTSGAIISGLGALGTAASMIPHPVARVVGTGVGLGAEGLNMFLDSLKKKPQMAEGGLAKKKKMSKAERAAKAIMIANGHNED